MRFSPEAPEQPGAEAGPVPNRVAQPSSTKFGQAYKILGTRSMLLSTSLPGACRQGQIVAKGGQVALEDEVEFGT